MDTERDFHISEIIKHFKEYRHFFTFIKNEDGYVLEICFPDFVVLSTEHLKTLEPFVKVTYIRPIQNGKGIVLECKKL